jgi:hypothetical protein
MRIDITIEGISPLLCGRFTDAAAQAATKGTRGSAHGDRGTEREICEAKLYLDAEGKPCIPQPNLLACIVDGGSWHKIGRRQVTTKTSSLLYSCCDVIGLTIPIKHKQPWSVDVRPVVIPATKGRILCYRPRFDDWQLSFEVELNAEIIGVKFLRDIIDDAGLKCGLGDYRPNHKGPFGKFKIIHWAEQIRKPPLQQAAE